ncbi:MAG: hypothetical protein K2P74_08645, partial [Nitrosomonas sp.]|nr:hypothetical protein [Nitrosomonas sp.]
ILHIEWKYQIQFLNNNCWVLFSGMTTYLFQKKEMAIAVYRCSSSALYSIQTQANCLIVDIKQKEIQFQS